ncbi:MAG: (4Fe-4S)-binding protein [Bacteroidota bacterium]
MTDPRNRQYTNGEITVFWTPSKCIHATTCFRELIEVFNPGRRPWVEMKGASTRRISEVVDRCPTQALEWKENSALTKAEKLAQHKTPGSEENPQTLSESGRKRGDKPASVRIMKDGPIVVEGNFSIVDSDDNPLKPAKMTSFCRCGHSLNMPYCDGRHRKIGFTDEPS